MSALDPGKREYTRMFVLPKPVEKDGLLRQVLGMGKEGRAVLINTDDGTPMSKRVFFPKNGHRPTSMHDNGWGSDQSTALPLLLKDGASLMVMGGCGGCNDGTQQRIHVYNVAKDTWWSVDTGIPRLVPSSVLLPDGNVLLVSGEPPGLDQARYGVAEAGSRDTRYPQIFDPEARTVTTLTRRDSAFRGYHNTAGLLKDGSILLGGGFEYHGDVGCENPTLRRLYPGYLGAAKGKRPVVTKVTAGGKVVMGGQQRGEPSAEVTPSKQGETALTIEYTGPKLHPTRGAALLAAQAFTHSYG